MATTSSNISFHFADNGNYLRNRRALKGFLHKIFKTHRKRLSKLDYIFCSDEELRLINVEFLNHDYYTDIITFDLSENAGIAGEIYISIDRVRENSKEFKTSFQSELHRVVFHGALHLCGLEDKTKPQQSEMRKVEDKLLKIYFKVVSRGT